MRLFDTHSHIQETAFTGDLAAVLERARAAGVEGVAVCGFDPASNEAALRLCEQAPWLHPTTGFHPHEAAEITPAHLIELEALAALPAVVAVGEIGLDFYRDLAPREAQRRVLASQLEIAVRAGKPVSVHTRGAEDEVYELLAPYAAASPLAASGRPPGVMHCFGGTLEQAARYLALGFLVSVPCAVTYPRSEEMRRLAAGLPLHALVIETDSPYLPPQTHRGRRNEPAFVAEAARGVAAARGIAPETVAEATAANAARLFAVRAPALVARR